MNPLQSRRQVRLLHTAAFLAWTFLVSMSACPARAEKKPNEKESLQRYLSTLSSSDTPIAAATTSGSLWTEQSSLFMIANDVKARRLHDLVTILVAEQTLAQAAGDVTSQRDYSGNSAITALGGHIGTGGVNPLFAASSGTSLKGKGQSNSNSVLQTTLAAEVVAILPNGNLVVEARRSIKMNNEQRAMTLRGVIRPTDVSAGNLVRSSAIAHLEIELKGKGVVSDGTRPNNLGIRWLWKVLGF